MEGRSHSNEIPIEMLLGQEQPIGFSFEIKAGRVSVGGWKKKGRPKDIILLRFEGSKMK